jgi:amicyanin
MNKSVLGIIIAVVAVGGIVAFAVTQNKDENPPTSQQTQSQQQNTSNDQQNTSAEVAQTGSVTIQNFAFNSKSVKVKIGATVTWTNQDEMQHTVTPDQTTDDFKGSDLLSKGSSYSVTFTKAGTYTYFCSPHPYMKGTVEVVE